MRTVRPPLPFLLQAPRQLPQPLYSISRPNDTTLKLLKPSFRRNFAKNYATKSSSSRPPAKAEPSLRNQTSESASSESNSSTSRSQRIDRLLARLPARYRPHADRLRAAPTTHVVAFLILHELTAVIPLLGLFGIFHYGSWLPIDYVAGHWGTAVRDGVNRFERYFRRKGWFGFKACDSEVGSENGNMSSSKEGEDTRVVLERWEEGAEPKYKILVEIGLAWAITKAMLPVRIIASLWATPWFARVLVRAIAWSRRTR